MDNHVPEVREARYRLLGIEALPAAGGMLIRRGRRRILIRGEGLGELLDLIVNRSAEGAGVSLRGLMAEVETARHRTLRELVDRLIAERLLVPAEGAPAGRRESAEEIFYWSHDADAAVARDNLAGVDIAVFGVNHISLPLLGNLRSCGIRSLTLIDHPALRNLDFFTERQELRSEIAAAMASPPRSMHEWSLRTKRPDCQVVCSDFGGIGLIRDWNRSCVADGALFYPVVLADEVARLGPLVVPREGPCYECLWLREHANFADPDFELASETHAFFGRPARGFVQPMARVAADLAAVDLLKYFSLVLPGGVAGRLIEADLMTPSLRARNVLKVPRCPVCSPARSGPEIEEGR
jgi:bacteriocin biosynthesis cyclodehydratase domain-containing protein